MNHINTSKAIQEKTCLCKSFFRCRIAFFAIITLFSFFISAFSPNTLANINESYVSTEKSAGKFTLSESGKSAPLCVSSQDYPGVIRVLKLLQTDIERVTNAKPDLSIDMIPSSKEIVLVGTLSKSPLIDKLVQDKKLDVTGIAGKWETFLIQIVEHLYVQ